MQNNMNNIAENSFGATMRSIIPADYYEEKLMNFHAFEKWWELAHLGDIIKKQWMNHAVKILDLCNLHM